MTQHEDLISVFGFLQHTTQGNLKNMLCDARFTDVHLNLLMKIIRTCKDTQFAELAEKGEIPRMKLSNAESALKEIFWAVCLETLRSRGLLSSMPVAKAA